MSVVGANYFSQLNAQLERLLANSAEKDANKSPT